MDAFWLEILKAFGPPIIVGVVAAYGTVKSFMSNLEARVSDNEESIQSLKEGQEGMREEMGSIRRLMTELNVKMGLMLNGKLSLGDGDDNEETVSDLLGDP